MQGKKDKGEQRRGGGAQDQGRGRGDDHDRDRGDGAVVCAIREEAQKTRAQQRRLGRVLVRGLTVVVQLLRRIAENTGKDAAPSERVPGSQVVRVSAPTEET